MPSAFISEELMTMCIDIIKEMISLFWFWVLIGSCTKSIVSTDLSVIPVASEVGKYEILNISDYASSISYIPLETNDNALIYESISQIIYEREQFIILDLLQSCMVFNKNGRYLHNLGKRGLGPEEYLVIRNISLYGDSIFLHTTSPTKIRIYHSDGSLIDILKPDSIPERYNLYAIWFLNPQVYLSDVVTMAANHSTASYPRALLLQEENNQLIINREYPYVYIEKEIGGFSDSYEVATVYRFKDQIRTYKAINDTVFTVGSDLEMDKAYVFDFGKYRASSKWMFEMAQNKLPIYIWPLNIMESSHYLFIEFFFGNFAPELFEYLSRQGTPNERKSIDYRVFGLFDKRTGKLKLMNQPIKKKFGFKNDIDGGPVIWPLYISSNDELVFAVQPEEFMDCYKKVINPSAELTDIAKKIKLDDNPIVIITHLK